MRSPASHLMLAGLLIGSPAAAQGMPDDSAGVLERLGKTGAFQGREAGIPIPRNDLTAIEGTLILTPLGWEGWTALAAGNHTIGDLVLSVARGVRAAVDRLDQKR